MPTTTQSKKYIYWLSSFSALFTIVLTAYYFLGGFVQIETAVAKNTEYSIVGKEVKGLSITKDEHLIFEEIKRYLLDSTLRGTMAVVNYTDDGLDKERRRFIGVLLNNEMSVIPSGYSILEITSKTTLQAALIMHPLVMPNTQKIETLLQKKADSLGYELEKFTLEKLYFDNSVIVEVFVK